MSAGPPLVIIGAGDHAAVILELALAIGRSVLGFVQPGAIDRSAVITVDLPILGDLLEPAWRDSLEETPDFVVALGDNLARAEAYARALAMGMQPASLVHPSATLLGGAQIGDGVQICAGAVIGVEAKILDDTIVNTAASVDHHDRVGPHAFVGPGAHLAGRVTVEAGAHIGIGAIVREGTIIGPGSYVAAGAVVVRDVAPGSRVAGIPAALMNNDSDPEEGR